MDLSTEILKSPKAIKIESCKVFSGEINGKYYLIINGENIGTAIEISWQDYEKIKTVATCDF